MDSHNLIIDIHDWVMDINNYFFLMQIWIIELWMYMTEL